MKFEEMADYLEEYMDSVVLHYETWVLLEGHKTPERIPIVREFVDWLLKEAKNDLVCPRGRKGISFLEGRRKHENI